APVSAPQSAPTSPPPSRPQSPPASTTTTASAPPRHPAALATPAARMTQRRKRIRRWYTMVGVLGVLTVIATCGVFSFYLVRDELAGRHAQATAGQDEEIVFQDISSREADPVPLTVDEVFPTDEIIINPAE